VITASVIMISLKTWFLKIFSIVLEFISCSPVVIFGSPIG
jgi:hypothetical protein